MSICLLTCYLTQPKKDVVDSEKKMKLLEQATEMNEETTFIDLNDMPRDNWLKTKNLAFTSVKYIEDLKCTDKQCTFRLKHVFSNEWYRLNVNKGTKSYEYLTQCQKIFPRLASAIIKQDGTILKTMDTIQPTLDNTQIEFVNDKGELKNKSGNISVICDDEKCVTRKGVFTNGTKNYIPLKTLYDTFYSQNKYLSIVRDQDHSSSNFSNLVSSDLLTGMAIGAATAATAVTLMQIFH